MRDLPEAWRARYQADLGIAPPDDRDGVLQDVHWYGGVIGGAFQGYTLGNILGAQFYAAALAAHPGSRRDRARASSARCTAGCARTSTGTAASSPRPSSSARHRRPAEHRAVYGLSAHKYGELYPLL